MDVWSTIEDLKMPTGCVFQCVQRHLDNTYKLTFFTEVEKYLAHLQIRHGPVGKRNRRNDNSAVSVISS
jgi:hypothetical protein